MRETLTFTIQNNRSAVIPVSLLGNNADEMDNANATTEYGWNLTGFTPTTENTLLLQYRSVNEVVFKTVQVPLQAASLQGIINTLNSLNLGIFYINQSGGNTFINNYNDRLVFGTLDVFDNTAPPQPVLNFTNNTTVIVSTLSIDVNASPIYNTVSGYGDTFSTPLNSGDVVTVNFTGFWVRWSQNNAPPLSTNVSPLVFAPLNTGDTLDIIWRDTP